jgi:NADH-quinone oxidoreductase subunit C
MIPDNLRENAVASALDDLATTANLNFQELTLEIAPENIVEAMRRLKQDLKFERLSTVTGVDRYPAEPRFEIVYHLQSVSRKERLRIKARISGENPEIDSVCGVYRSANWYERETFDLFGVIFRHHPDLTRIMLPQDWEGHPLRKDVPVTGTRY